jgi:hypothetical protein
MSSSSEEEEEDEEEDQREEESEEEEEEEEDSDSEYRHSQDDDDGENFIREQNVKALRDGLPLSKIRYASVLSNLKPPEPDEVILKRHFAPLVPGGALQTGTFLVCLLRFVSRVRWRSRFWIFERFFFVRRFQVFWVPTFEKKKAHHLFLSLFLLCSSLLRLYYISVLTILFRKRFLFLSYSWVTKSDSRSENIHPVRIEAQSRVAENYPVRRGRGRYRAPRRRRRVGVVARRG